MLVPQPGCILSSVWSTVIMFCLLQDNASPDEQIQIQLVSVPMYGILTRSQSQQEPLELREYSSFTMEDINTLRIRSEMLLLLIHYLSPLFSLLLCSP